MSADGAGVRVNGVSPGFTRTAALEAGIVPGAPNRDWPSRPTAMSRLVEPIEVAQARPFCTRLPAAASSESIYRSTPAISRVPVGPPMFLPDAPEA